MDFLILRTDALYCWIEKWQRVNSVLRVLDTLRNGKILNEVTDWYNTPTYVPDFVNAAEKLFKMNETGIFHVVGSEFINRYNWSVKVAEIFGLDKNLIKPIHSSTFNFPANRVNINLKNTKLITKTKINMKNIEEGTIEMLKNSPYS